MVRVVRLERTVSWSQTRRDTNFAIPGYLISAILPWRGRKSKIFLSVVIHVVKAAFMPFSAIKGNPANAGVTRLCGVSPCPVPDTATALPKQLHCTQRCIPPKQVHCTRKCIPSRQLRCTRRRIPPRQLRCTRIGAFLLYHNAGKMQVGMARKMRALGNL